jgi:acyl phosphate:glycerol-3-phosphate acyltransferase
MGATQQDAWIFWTLLAFLCGSVPFSLLIGFWVLHVDVRRYGDGNPGASNVIRVGDWRVGILAVLLDSFKGAAPVGTAYFFMSIQDWRIVPIAIAPVAGHAFSPWLRFRGGKAVAVTFGVWTGLTLGEAPILLGIFLLLTYFTVAVHGWAVILAMLGLLVGLLISYHGLVFLGVWLGNVAVLIFKHRHDLARLPGVNPVILRWLRRRF